MKSLYLNGRQPLQVRLDGPALRVRAPSQADRLFPLTRVRRILVSGQVEWTTEALLACADNQVGVSFLSREGRVRARLLGKPKKRPDLDLGEAFEILLERPDGVERYRTWVEAQAGRARQKATETLKLPRRDYGPEALRAVIRDRAFHVVSPMALKELDVRLATLLGDHLGELLAQVGIEPEAPFLLLKEVRLVRDFQDLLGWSLQADKLRLLHWRKRQAEVRGHAHVFVSAPALAKFFEQQREPLTQRFATLVLRLHAFLLEILDGDGP